MANSRLIQVFLNYTPAATSEDANFPVTNLSIYGHPFRPWKALVSTGIVDVTLDLGGGNTLSGLVADPAIFLYPVNVTSLRIQANSSLSWGSPPWDQAVTIANEELSGYYGGFWRFADLSAAAVAYRYINLRIPSQVPVDNAVYRIGVVVLGQMIELTTNPSSPLERPRTDPGQVLEMMDGGIEVIESGQPYLEFRLPRKLYSAAALTEQRSIVSIGIGSPFVYWDAALGGSQHAWLVRRKPEPSPDRQQWLNVHEGELALRQVT